MKTFKCRLNKKGNIVIGGKYCRIKDKLGKIRVSDPTVEIPDELIMRSVPTDVELLRHIDKTKSKEFNNDIAYIKSNIEHHNPAKFDQYLEDTLVRSAQHFKTSACGGVN